MNKILHQIYALLVRFSKSYSRKNLYSLLDSSIKKYCHKDHKIINIGSGGEIKKVLVKNGLNFKEIDIDKNRKPDYVCSIEQMDVLEDGSVDIFFVMEVLQYVNPFNAVKELEKKLKPNGMIIGSSPFVFPIHDEPFDFYRYTKYGLAHLFQNFRLVELVERNSYIESAYVILVRLVNVGTKRQIFIGALLFPLFLIMTPFVWLLSLIVTNKQSTTGYFFIFQKRSLK